MSKFWKAFDKLMDMIPSEIEQSFSEIQQNGKTVKVRTVNGKTTVTVNGEEYVPKKVQKNE